MESVLMIAVIASVPGAFIPILLDGVERKLKAMLQSRIGPPITQTLYDILKLLVKEYKPIHTGLYIAYSLASFVIVSFTALTFALLYALTSDMTYIVYASAMFALSTSLYVAIPLLIPNPFSQIGAWREVMVSLLNEAAFLTSIALFIITLEAGVNWSNGLSVLRVALTVFMLLVCGYVATGRSPFDIAEAEPELASGIFVELSGPLLALNTYSLLLKRLIVKVLVASLLVNALRVGKWFIALALTYLVVLALWILFGVVATILGRTRVDVGPSTLAKIYILLTAFIITVLLVDAYV